MLLPAMRHEWLAPFHPISQRRKGKQDLNQHFSNGKETESTPVDSDNGCLRPFCLPKDIIKPTSARRQPAATPPLKSWGPDPARIAEGNTCYPARAPSREKKKKNLYRLLCLLFLWQLLLGSLALGASLLSGGISSCDEFLQVLGSLFSLFLPGFNFAELLDEVFFFCHLQTRARKGNQSSRGGLARQGGHLPVTAVLWASLGMPLSSPV